MAISDTHPAESYTSNGKTVFPFNIVESEVTDSETGKKRTQYEYDEARVEGEVTRKKFIEAGIAARYSLEDEIATINNFLLDNVGYAAQYQEYQGLRQDVKDATILAISRVESATEVDSR